MLKYIDDRRIKMKKTLIILPLAAAGLIALPAIAKSGLSQSNVRTVKAATETTIYYAVSSDVVGDYTVKLNVNFKGDGDDWHTYTMEKTLDTLSDNDVYRCSYTDAYDGVGVMQFQLYDGDEWKSQQEPINTWTAVGDFNGKVYVHNDGWYAYTPDLETYIPMTSAFFTNWTDDAGSFRGVGANCWNDKSLNALGSVMDGCLDHEGWTGTLSSRRWHQTTEWIYFQYGCANNNHVGEASDVKLTFKFWASEDAQTPAYEHDFHNDTFCQTTMLLRNYRIPAEEYAALSGDFYMSVDLVDGRGNEYGANEFGYLHVNQTHQQVSNAQWYYYTHCVEGEAKSVDELRSNYYLNGSLRDGFLTGFAESFNTQQSFNTNWMKDGYGNDIAERHQDRAISQSTYRTDGGKNMPFNNENGFFKGWYGAANDDYEGHVYGYVASDDSMYRFLSKPFRLPENGIVSVKMAGNSASLHLIDFDGGHGELAFVDVKTFKHEGDENPIAATGKNVCTMVRHVINFSKYAGRLVQIGIADVDNKEHGWNAVYFDELNADYDELPEFKVDVVSQNADDLQSYFTVKDVYVTSVEADGGVDYKNNDGPETDECPLKEAHRFVSDYYSVFRNKDNFFEYKQGEEAVHDLVVNYSNLSKEVRAIVDDSMDFDHGTVHEGNWYEKQVRLSANGVDFTIGESVHYLSNYYNDPTLQDAIRYAKEDLEGYKAGQFREAEESQRQEIISTCESLLDNLSQYSQIGQIEVEVTAAKEAIDELKTNAQYEAELAAAKAEAKADLADYARLDDYRDEEKQEINSILADAYDKIDAATTVEKVLEEKAAAEALIDVLKTDAEYDAADVDALINAIPDLELSNYQEDEHFVTEARAAYEALSPEAKLLVEKLYVLQGAESRLADIKAGVAVDALIDAIGDVSINNEQAIIDARTAYNALGANQNRFVTKLETLQAAEALLAQLKTAAAAAKDELNAIDANAYYQEQRMQVNTIRNNAIEQIDAATSVEAINTIKNEALGQINQIKTAALIRAEGWDATVDDLPAVSNVTLADKEAIEAVRAAYEALDGTVKVLVTKLSELEAVEARLAELQAAKTAAEAVEAKITAIGEVDASRACAGRISDARTSYDALSADGKAFVENYETLTTAEASFAQALATAKQAGKDQIDALYAEVNLKKYSKANQEAIAQMVADAKSNIDGAFDQEEIAELVSQFETNLAQVPQKKAAAKGCGGSIVATSAILSTLALAGLGLAISKKRKED